MAIDPWRQWQDPWGDKPYDSTSLTMARKGCALTSLAMALKHRGIDTDPGRLNAELTKASSTNFDRQKNVMWDNAVRYAAPSLRFNYFKTKSSQQLEEALCQGQPVIVAVNGGTHFVLVTGKQGNEFLIIDPDKASNLTLNAYNNNFETRGTIGPAPSRSATNVITTFLNPLGSTTETDDGGLDFVVGSKVRILVRDEFGRRIGFDATTGNILEEIPGSVYFNDSLTDDETGQPATEGTYAVHIHQPTQGSYEVTLIGQDDGEYELQVSSYSQDGTPQARFLGLGRITANSKISYTLQYSATPPPVGMVLEEAGPQLNQVSALDAMLFTRDPFPVINPFNQLLRGSDRNTRVAIFVSNLQLARGENVVVTLTDGVNATFNVVAEDIRPVPNHQLTQLVFRLPNNIAVGQCSVRVSAHGQVSNVGQIRIRP